MKRRQIVILQDCLRLGGTERQSLWLARTLQNDAFAARLLLFRGPLPEGGDLENQGEILQNVCPRPAWWAPGLVAKLQGLKADLVICMGRNANSYAFRIRRRLPAVRVISTCRTSRTLPLLYRRGIARSHHCLTNSAWAADRLVAGGLKQREDITTIPNALLRPELLDLDRSSSAIAGARAALGLPRDRPILVNVASFVPGKNKQGLLRAFARSRTAAGGRAMLLLVGDGAERSACQQLAEQLGLADCVRFLGHTEAIAPILQASDLFVSTALRDALPNALVEAQAAGLPVIAYDTGGAAEAFVHGESGWSVPGGDEEAFARAIEAALDSEEDLSARGRTAREFARATFSTEIIADRYRRFVEEWLP